MSNAQAKALAKQIVAECYKGPFARYGSVQDWEQCIEKQLTAALGAREREVWEKAAKLWEEFANTDKKLKAGRTFADECRRQGGRG